ncbi:AzlC family ABC transporter permease [Amylibacter sp. IMCC11727]|uniref:AzlC family ABC transporter permease n=1 Tax=Amylibacter sp. IMCC11727 TaxID=3039851 RepID=UPI00244DF3EB|nr:AzlC family ABC transporter permease [Amylibacter sp. IMCC11727]WGI21660.1 AzlC family ABC transporter permease [Amylibacter sp. IMCC11727]
MTQQQTTSKSAFWAGYRDCMPFILVAGPFGMLFGVASTDLGLTLIETMTMTVLVIAGAAQFTALLLLEENAPTFIIILTALAVNLRMAMYSAAMVPYLGKAPKGMKLLLAYFNVDQSFGLASVRFPQEPTWTVAMRSAYFCGASLAIMPFWVLFTYLGAAFGTKIPDAFALDFALPICFLAIIAPALRTLPHVLAAAVSVIGALLLSWVPFSLGLIIAAIAAMMSGAFAEKWLQDRNS